MSIPVETQDPKPAPATTGNRTLAAHISQGTLFGILANGVQVGTRLLTVPIVIAHLGLGGYGIWSIIMVTVAYMRFGTAGVKSAFQKYVAEATGNGDFDHASKLVSTGSISMLVLSILCLIPIALCSSKLATISGVPVNFLPAAAQSITILALILVIANFGAAYEAVIMGGQRIDLARKLNIGTTIGEAIAIILVLHFGYGLVAMSIIMATSELIYILACYFFSKRIAPQIVVSLSNFSKKVLPELVRFAGSFQLVNVLEVLYGAILPVFILKFYGAESAGIFAVANRVATSALVAQDALSLSILSGGAIVFASGSAERMRSFLKKSFKAMFLITLPPLAFVSVFGEKIVTAWTGQSGPLFGTAIALVSIAGLLKGVSLLQLVLYRATGRALLDNIRQVLRIVVLLIVASMGRMIGFRGLLLGCAAAELAGVIFMFFAMSATFKVFSAKLIAGDTIRVVAATALTIAAGWGVSMVLPQMVPASPRIAAALELGGVCLASLLIVVPVVTMTGAVSSQERNIFLRAVLPW